MYIYIFIYTYIHILYLALVGRCPLVEFVRRQVSRPRIEDLDHLRKRKRQPSSECPLSKVVRTSLSVLHHLKKSCAQLLQCELYVIKDVHKKKTKTKNLTIPAAAGSSPSMPFW